MSRTGSSRLLILLILPFTEVRGTLFLNLLESRCLFLHPKEKHRSPRFLLLLWNASRHHCLCCGHDPHDDILLGFEDHHLPRFDQFTMWGEMTSEEILAEQVVDIHRIAADFRERIQTSASGVNKFFTPQSPVQRRLCVYNSNPGPRRDTEDAIEKQLAGKWHLITLQEASDYRRTRNPA